MDDEGTEIWDYKNSRGCQFVDSTSIKKSFLKIVSYIFEE